VETPLRGAKGLKKRRSSVDKKKKKEFLIVFAFHFIARPNN
jgi:hypothetical protein